MSRHLPDGRLLRWHLLFPTRPLDGGLIPFFIDWGENRNPSPTVAQGCRLIDLHGESRSPETVTAQLEHIGIDLEVVSAATRDGLVATIEGPRGRFILR